MNKREWMIAIPVIAGVAACIGAYFWGTRIEDSFDGIVAMRSVRTPAGVRTGVVAGKAFHWLDASGKRLARQELSALDIRDSPNDMDLTIDAEGHVEAWFFDDDEPAPRVIRCAWDDNARRLDKCTTAAKGPQLKTLDSSRAVHLAVDRAGERMFIADAQGGRVQQFDLAGKRIGATDPAALPLSYPNRLRYLGDDRLLIADNDHHRAVWTEIPRARPAKFVSQLYSSAHPQFRSNRAKVTDVAVGNSGTVWMLAVKQGQKDGDVLVFDAARKPVARAELPDGADPLIVESLGDTALIADYSHVMLYRVDAAGRYLGEFGDDAFRAELAPMRALARQSRLLTTGSMVAGAVVIVAGLILGWRFSEKPAPKVLAIVRDASAASGFDEPLQFPVVLDQLPKYTRAMRVQGMMIVLMLVVTIGVVVFIALKAKGATPPGWKSIAQVAIYFLGAGVAASQVARDAFMPTQLRITASRVGVFRRGKCVAEATLDDVYATEHVILVGRRRVIYKRPQGKAVVYDVNLLTRALLARLPAANLMDGQALNKIAMAKQPVAMKLFAVIAVVLVLIVVFRDSI